MKRHRPTRVSASRWVSMALACWVLGMPVATAQERFRTERGLQPASIEVPGGVADAPLSLAGEWSFAMNEPAPAFPQAALPELTFSDTIHLPGTTETNNKGPANPKRERERLTRIHLFNGPAWYQRRIEIPAAWQGRQVRLLLERTRFTQVWLDGQALGSQVLYCVPQIYDLGKPTPGTHTLTVMVDSRLERRPFKCWDAHQLSDNTQTIWNGILGRIELQAVAAMAIEDVQVFPNVGARSARVRVTLGNTTGLAAAGTLVLTATSWNHAGAVHAPPPVRQAFAAAPQQSIVEVEYPLGDQARLWDEFSPKLYHLDVSLESGTVRDRRVVDFGLREFKTRDGQFTINGRTTFLRGKHDGCVFPLTGHPPMDVDGWMKYLQVCKDYGINHIRCHTWVPPEAALAAADRLGIYFQPELPFWGPFSQDTYDGLMPEAERMLRDYGNHPSWVMMTLGNELKGERPLMEKFVRSLRAQDPRHLYACGSNIYYGKPLLSPADDFWSTMYTTAQGDPTRLPVRGSFYDGDGGGIIQKLVPNTRHDYRSSLAGIPIPVIGHEIAQYSVYPDYREIPKYTGVVRARNFEIFRDKLMEMGMADQADAFTQASGKLSALCYREEIEMALRTPGFGGFQLLDLQDFPGQGTALVGILNAFMESKGLITPSNWRNFCAPVVPLARFDRFTWTTAETFQADVEIAHYGAQDITPVALTWACRDAAGQTLATGELTAPTLKQGGLRRLGSLAIPLANIKAPAVVTLDLTIKGTPGANSYPLWIYTNAPPPDPPAGVTLARSFNDEARAVLTSGGRVLLVAESGKLGNTVGGGFATDFWCWSGFHNKPGTMGLWCDPRHPALAGFPTESHSNWQWFRIAMESQPVILDDTPKDYRPLVQVIDNAVRCHKLGLVFEARVGPGRLLVCASDLIKLHDCPEARQLYQSLLDYAGSERFRPAHDLSPELLTRLLAEPPPKPQKGAK